jgi:citrate lyase beta subunit
MIEQGRQMTVPRTGLGPEVYTALDAHLADADAALRRLYPGSDGTRQPIHTVYVPGDRFHAGSVAEWGSAATELLNAHAPDAATLAGIVDISADLAQQIYPRVTAKLAAEPIEDLRIDFEDGYGAHSDDEEDTAAVAAATELARALKAADAPPFVGIRFKSMEAPTRRRGIRTVDIFLSTLAAENRLPDGLMLTLPKVTDPAQVEAFGAVCEAWEQANSLPNGRLRFEVQIETPQAILGANGTANVARIIQAGAGRVSGLHYGTYDFSAACGVSADYQSLAHPIADHAKAVMQLAAAGTGVRLSDGSSNVLPTGDADSVRAAWRLHASLVRRSLERAYYQGWDLHPGHLVTRYAATFAFYRNAFPGAADRLRKYLAGTVGGILDEPATAQALAAILVRGVHSGALDVNEVGERSGIDQASLDRLYRRRVQ